MLKCQKDYFSLYYIFSVTFLVLIQNHKIIIQFSPKNQNLDQIFLVEVLSPHTIENFILHRVFLTNLLKKFARKDFFSVIFSKNFN